MTVDPVRSNIMRSVGRVNTKPELVVRRLLYGLGLRFRLHRAQLPGTPDIVLPKFRVALFVHGCFWHRHTDCSKATTPKTRTDFWQMKFRQNAERDRRNEQRLVALGWRPITVWECETRNLEELGARLILLLPGQSADA
jgi:DNA mismatch endonuclease (patch repair protein)